MRRLEPVVAAPLAAVALGTFAILVSRQGAGDRPWLAGLAIAFGVAAALAPLRFALPAVILVGAFNGFLIDFAGAHATYWNEGFVVVLAARALLTRRPTAREAAVGSVLAAVFLGYLVTGTRPLAVFWGAKTLLLAAVAGWSLWRLRPGRKEWEATFYGLGVAAGANALLAIWQRHEGVVGLRALGLSLTERVRLGPDGGLRAFGGFTSHAPFSYTLCIALIMWAAFALDPETRWRAFNMSWVPAAAGVGLALAQDRAALLGLAAAAATLCVRERRLSIVIPTVGAAVAIAAVAFVLARDGSLRLFGDLANRESSTSATLRVRLWEDYLAELEPFGAGPASAGASYQQADPPQWRPPLAFPRGWPISFVQDRKSLRWIGTTARLVLTPLETARRPRMRITADVVSNSRRRRLEAFLGNERIAARRVLPGGFRPLVLSIPAGTGTATIALRASPPAQSVRRDGAPPDVAVLFRDIRLHGAPPARTPALRVYQRVWDRTVAPETALGGIEPGVVDNQYVSWTFQYGVLGVALCLVWIGILLSPFRSRAWSARSQQTAAPLVAAFLLVAAVAVNVWEETPVDMLAALLAAQWLAPAATAGRGNPRMRSHTRRQVPFADRNRSHSHS